MNEGKPYMKKRKWLAASLEEQPSGGSSMKKLLSLWSMVLITLLHVKYLNAELKDRGDFAMIPQFLSIDYTAIGVFLGLVYIPQIIQLVTAYFNRNKQVEQEPGEQIDVSCIKQPEQGAKKND